MAKRRVWVQGQAQQLGAGAVRTWHLEAFATETLCGRSTSSMKAAPGAIWAQVLNPCSECQAKADRADNAAQHNIAS
jgi:hypothetical protein